MHLASSEMDVSYVLHHYTLFHTPFQFCQSDIFMYVLIADCVLEPVGVVFVPARITNYFPYVC